jgi:hypothetical protein
MRSGKRQRARIMITVKTYPELSNKYRETSCVAGIGSCQEIEPLTHRGLPRISVEAVAQDKVSQPGEGS